MEKPIISTTISGLFIKHEPWQKAHILWFEERELELKDQNKNLSAIEDWKKLLQNDPKREEKEFFRFVDIIMKELHPDLSDEERTKKARETYFDSVVSYIELYPEVINNEVIDYFLSIKNKFKLALVTTNTEEALGKILEIANIKDLFDIIEYSFPEEKDNKELVFSRFIEKHSKPVIYLGGGREASYDFCKQHSIKAIFANLENDLPIEDVENINSLEELREKINMIN